MGMKFSDFVTSSQKEKDGVWVEFGDDFAVKLARQGNQEYQNMVRRLGKPHQRALRKNMASSKITEEIVRKATAKHIVLDWRGLEEDDGTEIKYSPDKALELLTQSTDFLNQILEASDDMQLFRDVDSDGDSDDDESDDSPAKN